LKSEGEATTVPLIRIVAEEMRCVPSASPLTTCMTKGAVTLGGTAIVSV
jgi:hypothetical protein